MYKGAVGKQPVRGDWEWEGIRFIYLSLIVHNMLNDKITDEEYCETRQGC